MIAIDTDHLSDGLYQVHEGQIWKYKGKGGKTTKHKITIDAVSVVRCKECKHYKYTEGFEHGRYYAGYGCELGLRQVTADDFCSYGERSDT